MEQSFGDNSASYTRFVKEGIMKIALIGDIHANLPALEAVLEHAHQHGVDEIWSVGDIVGYGAFPDEVVKLLQKENVKGIIGNYDLKVLKVKQKRQKWKKDSIPEKWIAFNWAYENLSEESIEYLNSLPTEMRLEVEGKKMLLVHGSPDSNEEHLTPDTSEERLLELANIAQADVVVVGHSHQPFKKKVGDVWFINTGSVGRPDDGDPRASYAILSIKKPNIFQVHHYRVEYDVQRAISAIEERGLPKLFAEMIRRGKSLDDIKREELDMPSDKQNDVQASEEDIINASIQLAKSCGYEPEHTNQVTRLALRLFDELASLHGLGSKERFWLQNAAILHDIGWIEGPNRHHKTALRIILEDQTIPLPEDEKLIVASIARYHRAALPKKKHKHYASLDKRNRQIVKILASILRVADGLDRTHQSIVNDVSCDITPDQIIISCAVKRPSEGDRQAALDKGDLMEKVFNRTLVVEWKLS